MLVSPHAAAGVWGSTNVAWAVAVTYDSAFSILTKRDKDIFWNRTNANGFSVWHDAFALGPTYPLARIDANQVSLNPARSAT